MRHRIALIPSVSAAALLCFAFASEAPAAKKDKAYLHPQYESLGVGTIGLLPWLQRKYDSDAERIMRLELAQGLEPSGYRFTNDTALRTMSRSIGAESLLVSATDQYRKDGTIRAETLVELGKRVSVDAVLAPFLDRWERETIEVTVRGNSRTDIGTRLALYSTKTGELLWSTYVEESGEGPYNDPGTGGEVGTNPLASQTGPAVSLEPPSFEDVADRWSKKLTKAFPPRPKVPETKVDAAAKPGD